MNERGSRRLAPGILAAFVFLGSVAVTHAADKPRAVIELFTSQGCNSCPPADALFRDLAERDDVVALAYHIDYWDYLGWKDALATSENTNRQQAYAEVFGGSVYTPQLVIDGSGHVVGSERDKVEAAVSKAALRGGLSVGVDISSTPSSVLISIDKSETVSGAANIVLIYFQPERVVEIERGQNAGRQMDYRNIVTSFQTVGMWHGDAMRIEIPKNEMEKKGGRCAVLLQRVDADGRPGEILGAAKSTEADW